MSPWVSGRQPGNEPHTPHRSGKLSPLAAYHQRWQPSLSIPDRSGQWPQRRLSRHRHVHTWRREYTGFGRCQRRGYWYQPETPWLSCESVARECPGSQPLSVARIADSPDRLRSGQLQPRYEDICQKVRTAPFCRKAGNHRGGQPGLTRGRYGERY